MSAQEWMSYEDMLPSHVYTRIRVHVAALVWDGFLDDCEFATYAQESV